MVAPQLIAKPLTQTQRIHLANDVLRNMELLMDEPAFTNRVKRIMQDSLAKYHPDHHINYDCPEKCAMVLAMRAEIEILKLQMKQLQNNKLVALLPALPDWKEE